MSRTIAFAAFTLVGCATGDRVAPAPVAIPDDGATVSYADLVPSLRQVAWRATESFYRDDWANLTDAATSLEKAANVLKQSKNVPARVQPDLTRRCDELAAACVRLRTASEAKAADQVSTQLQQVHNLVRDLRPEI